jgi:8-oxo-dGTP pyrophosphatase MutT (NUDIX family)
VASFFYKDASAPRPNRPRRVSVVALIEHEGRLLLERRADAPLWGLIAGGLEDDETLVEGLRREVREETGLEVETYSLFGTFSDPSRIVRYPDGAIVQVITVAYSVTVRDVSALRLSAESVELRFFAPGDLPVDEIVATQGPIVEGYLSTTPPQFLD